jgi:EF hand domain-containing protein
MKKKIALIIAGAIALPAVIAAAHTGGGDKAKGEQWKARHAEMLQKYDADHDGKLSPEEKATMIHDLAAARFAALDTNKDGALSPAEFEAGMKEMRERRFAHRHHGGGDDQVK